MDAFQSFISIANTHNQNKNEEVNFGGQLVLVNENSRT